MLDWIVRRVAGDAEAVETPIGRIPADGELDLEGVDISPDQAAELFAVNADSWLAEADLTEEYYAKFGDRVPAQLRGQLDALRSRLQQA